MLYELKESIKEILYGVFGDTIYEVDFRLIVLAIAAPFLLAFFYLIIRYIRNSILKPIATNKRKIDQIAIMVAENNHLLKSMHKGDGTAARADLN